MKDTLDALSNIIFNSPATIAFWSDKTKTVIKCSSEERRFDEEKGLAIAILKKIWEVSGMEGNYYRQIFKKWIKEEEKLKKKENDGQGND